VKLECFEIILFNALAFFIHKSKKRATTARIQITFKALKFYQKSCDLNDGNGCFNLGLSYEEGKGVSLYESPRLEQPPLKFKSHAFW
jgi:TPR repeat protein